MLWVEIMLIDDFLPVYDVSDSVATVVNADVATTWDALMQVDLIGVARQRRAVGMLSALRALPEIVTRLLHGESLPHAPEHLRLHDSASIPPAVGGWVLLGERAGDEIALGSVGKFWLPVIEFASVNRERFCDFAEPGYAKTIYDLSVRALAERQTLLTGVMRTATTDDEARRWFRCYWTLGVGSGAHILVNGVLDSARELAERRRESVQTVSVARR
jgi:hypothetical protein